jgi:hypothetical protein
MQTQYSPENPAVLLGTPGIQQAIVFNETALKFKVLPERRTIMHQLVAP